MDVVLTYETLFDLLRKEKGREELQTLPLTFYRQVVAYLTEKRGEVEKAGGLHSSTAQRALVQYRNVEKILRELFERRERKIIEMALNRARTERDIINTAALLPEEARFFNDLTDRFKCFRSDLLVPVLESRLPVDVAAELPPTSESVSESSESERVTPASVPDAHPDTRQLDASRESYRVKFLTSVPRFLGLKGEVHGPFSEGDEAELPGKIASLLVRKRRAEEV